jgi:hypothetical protein
MVSLRNMRGSKSPSPVRSNKKLALTVGVSDALAAPVAQRKAAVRAVLQKHPGPALSLLSKQTLRRVFLVMGFSVAQATLALNPPKLPAQGLVTPAGNASAAGLSWRNRVVARLPSRQQAINAGGIIATAINPLWAFRALAVSTTSRTQASLEHTLQGYENSVNMAKANADYYLNWTMFIAFLAVISHFIPYLAMNLKRTVQVFTTGNAAQAVELTGKITAKALQGGRSRSRSRSRARPALPAAPRPSQARGIQPLNARTLAAIRRMSAN